MMNELFSVAPWQKTGSDEIALRLIGLVWAVPDFGTLSRRQKS